MADVYAFVFLCLVLSFVSVLSFFGCARRLRLFVSRNPCMCCLFWGHGPCWTVPTLSHAFKLCSIVSVPLYSSDEPCYVAMFLLSFVHILLSPTVLVCYQTSYHISFLIGRQLIQTFCMHIPYTYSIQNIKRDERAAEISRQEKSRFINRNDQESTNLA